MDKTRLSVCYMVKNEAINLPVSLKSVQGVADEIIVVDTGSTDNTKEIAKEYGAQIFDFPWCDDFSAPRNFAIEQAQGDWILFLDADEAFALPMDRKNMLSYLDSLQDIDVVLLMMYHVDTWTERERFNKAWLPRIFRRQKNLRYRGRIHEHIDNTNGDLQVVYGPENWHLLHTGYAAVISEDKSRRNLQILQQVISDGEWEPVYDYYLTDCYYGMKLYDEALQHAVAFAKSGTVVFGGNGHIYHMIMECMRALQSPDAEMLPWAEEACRLYPDLPDFYAERGMVLCGLGRLIEASELLREALRRYEEGTADIHHETYFSPEVAGKVAARLGEIADIYGDKEQAARYFVQALDYCSTNKKILAKAKKFLKNT